MTLDWIPIGRTYTEVDDEGPKEYQVAGIAAYSEGEQCYEIWPIDPKGTPSDGWKLTLDNRKYIEDLGVFADHSSAKDYARQHRDEQRESGDEGQA